MTIPILVNQPKGEIWLVRGQTSGNIENQPGGLVEWQFSDGPAGERGSSDDFTSLEEGLAAYSGYIVHYRPED